MQLARLRQQDDRVRRRDLLFFTCAAVALPAAVRAQQPRRIGFLTAGNAPFESVLAAFRLGLSQTGYIEGQNLAVEYLRAEGNYERLPALAADLVARNVVLIVSIGVAASVAVKKATSTIPIVFMGVSDPLGVGLVTSLGRPGGNATGFSNVVSQLTPKRLELLSELVPQAKVIGLLINPNSPATLSDPLIADMQAAARGKEIRLAVVKAGTEGEIDAAFATLLELRAGGLVVSGDPFLGNQRAQLAALAARHAIPTIYHLRLFVEAGGLISYGLNFDAVFTQTGIYVGKILNGAKPSDLPVQQPTNFELVINLKAAKALGLTVPHSLLQRADEILE